MTGQRLLFPELAPADLADGWLPEAPQITTEQVLGVLARRHPMDGYGGEPAAWVFMRELCATTGEWGSQQRFDAVALGLLPRVGFARVVYEVKVSRSDWLREIRPRTTRLSRSRADYDGEAADVAAAAGDWTAYEALGSPYEDIHVPRPGNKWDAAFSVSTEFWYAAPANCILPAELPEGAGLLEIRPRKTRGLEARVLVEAPTRDTPVPDMGFWAAVARRMAGTARPVIHENLQGPAA